MQMTLALARVAGQEGMRQVAAAAEARAPGVTDVMFAFLVKFAQRARAGDRFTAEAVSIPYAQDPCFLQPKDMRAWGPVFERARKAGYIAIADYTGSRKLGHGVKGAKRWRSLVTRGRAPRGSSE